MKPCAVAITAAAAAAVVVVSAQKRARVEAAPNIDMLVTAAALVDATAPAVAAPLLVVTPTGPPRMMLPPPAAARLRVGSDDSIGSHVLPTRVDMIAPLGSTLLLTEPRRTFGSGVYGTVVGGTLRTADGDERDVAIKIQAMQIHGVAEIIDEGALHEGALLAAMTRRRDATGIPRLHGAVVVRCLCDGGGKQQPDACDGDRPFVFLAMDVARGRSLMMQIPDPARIHRSVVMRTLKLQGAALRRLALAMVLPLAQLHAEGVYVGDVKPVHFVVDMSTDRDGGDGDGVALPHVALIDYGFACETGHVRRWEMYTAWWRAFEAWYPHLAHTIGPPSDIWAYALCVPMAARACVGQPLFTAETTDDMHAQLPSLPARLRRSVAPDTELGDLLCACIAHVPSDRPSAATIIARLEQLVYGGSSSPMSLAGTPSPLPQPVDFRAVAPTGDGAASAAAAAEAPPPPVMEVTAAPVVVPVQQQVDTQELEHLAHMLRTHAYTEAALQLAGRERLRAVVEGTVRSAWRVHARLCAPACPALWSSTPAAAAYVSMAIALRLHWPVSVLYKRTGEIVFNDADVIAGHDIVLRTRTPEAATLLVERALNALGFDVLQ